MGPVHVPSSEEARALGRIVEAHLALPDRLAAFLADSARTPFALGRFDCLLWLADWIKLQRGVDPAAHLRGTYGSTLGYARHIRRAGGVAPLVASCVEPIGLQRTSRCTVGDIGIVQAVTTEGFADVGAIVTAKGWAMLGVSGLLVTPAVHVAAWRV